MRIYSQDVGMEFGIEKWAVPVMKNGKRNSKERMELPNQDKIITLGEKENLKILGDIGNWHHQTSGDERKKLKRVSQKN